MLVNHIPPFEERPLVHSETVLIDLMLISNTVSDSALQQLSTVKTTLEHLLIPGAMICQLMGPMKINDINAFRSNLNAADPTFDKGIVEKYRMHLMSGGTTHLSEDAFFRLYYDTIYKVYHTYHFFFCNFIAELKMKCNVLGFALVDVVLHRVEAANCIGKLSFGCYGK